MTRGSVLITKPIRLGWDSGGLRSGEGGGEAPGTAGDGEMSTGDDFRLFDGLPKMEVRYICKRSSRSRLACKRRSQFLRAFKTLAYSLPELWCTFYRLVYAHYFVRPTQTLAQARPDCELFAFSHLIMAHFVQQHLDSLSVSTANSQASFASHSSEFSVHENVRGMEGYLQKQKDSKSKQREQRHAFGERRSSIGALSSPLGSRGTIPTHILRGEDVTPEQRGWNGSVERPALRMKVGAFGVPPPLCKKSNSAPPGSISPSSPARKASPGDGKLRRKSRTPTSRRAHPMDMFKSSVSVELEEIDMLKCNPTLAVGVDLELDKGGADEGGKG